MGLSADHSDIMILDSYKAILFDLDGVLIDTEDTYTELWGHLGSIYAPENKTLSRDVKGTTIGHILSNFFPPELADEVRSSFYALEEQMEFRYFPGVVRLLQTCRAKGLKIAIATSSDAAKMSALRKQHPELWTLTDTILTAEDMRASKPAPDCWLQAAERLGVDISDCIVAEDSVNGLKSARASGGFVVGVTTGNPAEVVSLYADLVLSTIDGLLL